MNADGIVAADSTASSARIFQDDFHRSTDAEATRDARLTASWLPDCAHLRFQIKHRHPSSAGRI